MAVWLNLWRAAPNVFAGRVLCMPGVDGNDEALVYLTALLADE